MDSVGGEDTPAFGDFEDLETGAKFQSTEEDEKDEDPEEQARKQKKLDLKEKFNSEYDEVCFFSLLL